MLCVVALVDQFHEAAEGAVSVTEPPAQNVSGPEALITGFCGTGFTIIVLLVELLQGPRVTVSETM